MTIRVLVADDSYLAREGIARILGDRDDIDIVDQVGDLDAARKAVEEHQPDVLVVDVRMPPTGTDEGIRIAAELRDSRPDVAVLVLSQIADPAYAMELFKGGTEGRGYIVKDSLRNQGELTNAVHEVAAGGSYVDSQIVTQLLAPRSAHPVDVLTSRELEILGLLAEGRSNASIAVATSISKRGVERHVNAIFAKLGLSDSSDVNRRVMATLLYLAARPRPDGAP